MNSFFCTCGDHPCWCLEVEFQHELRELRNEVEVIQDELISKRIFEFELKKQIEDLTDYVHSIKEGFMHKKIMEKAEKALKKDAKHYEKEAKHTKSKTKKKHERVEEHEAKSAAKDLKKG